MEKTTAEEILEIFSLAGEISRGESIEGIVVYVDDIQSIRHEYESYPFSARVLLEQGDDCRLVYVVPYRTVRGFAIYTGKITFANSKREYQIEFVSSNSPNAECASLRLGEFWGDWMVKDKAIFKPRSGGFKTCDLTYAYLDSNFQKEIIIRDLRSFYESGKGIEKIEDRVVGQPGVHGLDVIDILDQDQNRILRRPMGGKLFICGEAGTGKTVTMIRRIDLLSSYEGLHEEDKKIYSPENLPTWALYFPTNSLRDFTMNGIQNNSKIIKIEGNIETWESQRITFSKILGIPTIESDIPKKVSQINKKSVQVRRTVDTYDLHDILGIYESKIIAREKEKISGFIHANLLSFDEITLTLGADEPQLSEKRRIEKVPTKFFPKLEHSTLYGLMKWESSTKEFIKKRRWDLQGSFFLVFRKWNKHISDNFLWTNENYQTTVQFKKLYGDAQDAPLGYISKMINKYRELLNLFSLNDKELFNGMKKDNFDPDRFGEFLEPGLVSYMKIEKQDVDYLVELLTYMKYLDDVPHIDLDMSMSLWDDESLQPYICSHNVPEVRDMQIFSQHKKLKLYSEFNRFTPPLKEMYDKIMEFSRDQIYVDEVNNLSPFAASTIAELGNKSVIFAGDLKQKTQSSVGYGISSNKDLQWVLGNYETIELKKSYRLSPKLQHFVFKIIRDRLTIDLRSLNIYDNLSGNKPCFIEEYSENIRTENFGSSLLSLIKSWVIRSSTFPTILIMCSNLHGPVVAKLESLITKFLNDLSFLSEEEKLMLNKDLKELEDLDYSRVQPKTDEHRHFVRVCQGLDYPKFDFEKTYRKYKSLDTNPIRFVDFNEIEGHQCECAIVLDPQLIPSENTLNLALTRSSNHLGFMFTQPGAWMTKRRYLEKYQIRQDSR
jgi:uncharacterized protein YifE (UPF0438 family)